MLVATNLYGKPLIHYVGTGKILNPMRIRAVQADGMELAQILSNAPHLTDSIQSAQDKQTFLNEYAVAAILSYNSGEKIGTTQTK